MWNLAYSCLIAEVQNASTPTAFKGSSSYLKVPS